jgi:tripartite-type tricarboxylate transporter receptor subunit TctC
MHVPYRDMNAVFTQMLGGEINASIGSFISVQPLAESGKVRLLGIARATRSPDHPNLPIIADTVPGYASGGWFGIIGPAGVPREITNLINKEVNWALQQPDVRERMKKMGLEIHTESPEFFTDLMNKDFENWGKVVKGMGFKPL